MWEAFGWGVLGGVFAELLGLFRLRKLAPEKLPQWLKSPLYWIITVAMILAGGGLVIVYVASGVDLKPIVAVNIGASAPLILGSLVTQTPEVITSD